MKIAHGAAKGLEFLHEAENPVIYRDFKASNILLDAVSIALHLELHGFPFLFHFGQYIFHFLLLGLQP